MLIKQAIHIKLKSDMHPAIISDYELAYALGYACKKFNLKPENDLVKMREYVILALKEQNLNVIENKNLFDMLVSYGVSNNAPENEKVIELIQMGYEYNN